MLRVISWLVFALAIVWPSVALIVRCITEGDVPDGGFTISARQWSLLGQSVWLSALATGVCLLFSVPAAIGIARCGHLSRRPIFIACLLGVLLCPATIYVLGWSRILPSDFSPHVRCVGVWALWAWPIPALLIGSGWSRSVRPVYEAALLATAPLKAMWTVALPLLLRYITLSALIVFVLFFSDYGVPHACLLRVYATELLGWATSSSRTIDTLWPAWPAIAITLVLLVFLWRMWGGVPNTQHTEPSAAGAFRSSGWMALALVCCFAVSWLWPVGTLTAKMVSEHALVETLTLYSRDLLWSLVLSILAGILSIVMGVGLVWGPAGRRVALSWTVVCGALPGAVIGAALIAAYNNPASGWVYDHWPIVVLSYVARFGWVGVATAWMIRQSVRRDLLDQALVDGADDGFAWGFVQVPMYWPTLLCGVAVVAALSLADVSASSLVRVPDFNPVAHILIEKFHRFEDGMLISLSLLLVVATFPPALLFSFVLRRWYRR